MYKKELGIYVMYVRLFGTYSQYSLELRDFTTKCLNLGIMGGEKTQNWPESARAAGPEPWGSIRGWDVPHTGVAVPTPRNGGEAAAPPGLWVCAHLSLNPPGNSGAAPAQGREEAGRKFPVCSSRRSSAPGASRALTLHLSHLSCQNEALAPPEPR